VSNDCAPAGSATGGQSTGVNDECVARFPNAQDTGRDNNDFQRRRCTYGAANL
jgi:hypothetical protein